MAISGLTGIVPSNLPTNQRAVYDANFIVSRALPSSATTVYSSSLDLADGGVSGIPYATTETVNVVVTSPDTDSTDIPNSSTLAYALQDSADNSSFAAIGTLATQTLTGAAGAGTDATTFTFKLPPNTRRYIRLAVTTAGSPGDCSAKTAYLKIAF